MLGFSFRRLREERDRMSGSGQRAVDGLWTGGGRAVDGLWTGGSCRNSMGGG